MHNQYHKNKSQHSVKFPSNDNQKNKLMGNLAKFQNNKQVNKTIQNEIDDWTAYNKESDVKFVSLHDHKIVISMINGTNTHLIEIICPHNYPDIKKGFSVKEIPSQNVQLNFIPKARQQFEGKILSIERVLSHLTNTFIRYK